MIDEALPEALAGERLDRVVAMLSGCSRRLAAELIDGGAVAVDGLVVTQRSHRVGAGSHVRFEPIDAGESALEPDDDVEFGIIHADAHIVVVDKPAGLVVHPGAGRRHRTLCNGLLARFPDIVEVGDARRPGIVHRLDVDTSGVMVVARSSHAYDALVADLAARAVTRLYTAIVRGVVADDRGVIDAPIGRSMRRRTRMTVVADGKHARTHYEVVARRSDPPEASELECRLETGRTHQIRVHLSAIGHPVVGDVTYGARDAEPRFERVALHARRLELTHPGTGEHERYESPLPDDMAGLVETLGLRS